MSEQEIDTAAIRASYGEYDLTCDIHRLCDALDAARAEVEFSRDRAVRANETLAWWQQEGESYRRRAERAEAQAAESAALLESAARELADEAARVADYRNALRKSVVERDALKAALERVRAELDRYSHDSPARARIRSALADPQPAAKALGETLRAHLEDDPAPAATGNPAGAWPTGCRCHRRTGLRPDQHENDCPLTSAAGKAATGERHEYEPAACGRHCAAEGPDGECLQPADAAVHQPAEGEAR